MTPVPLAAAPPIGSSASVGRRSLFRAPRASSKGSGALVGCLFLLFIGMLPVLLCQKLLGRDSSSARREEPSNVSRTAAAEIEQPKPKPTPEAARPPSPQRVVGAQVPPGKGAAAKPAAKPAPAPVAPAEPRGLRCRDGTLSPTCMCGGPRRGCCSHHGGVAGCE